MVVCVIFLVVFIHSHPNQLGLFLLTISRLSLSLSLSLSGYFTHTHTGNPFSFQQARDPCNIPSGSCYASDPAGATTLAKHKAWYPWAADPQ